MPSPANSGRRVPLRPLAGLVVVVGGSVLLARHGAAVDLDAARADLRASGAWGVALFLLAFTLLQPLHVSGHLFSFTAVLVWGQPAGFFLTWLGSSLSTVSAFAFARHLAHDYVQSRIPERLRHLDDRLERSGFRQVLLLRCFLWGTPALGFAFGVSRVRGRTHHVASLLGVLPQVALSSAIASGLAEAIERGEVGAGHIALGIAGLALVVLVAFALGRRVLDPRP